MSRHATICRIIATTLVLGFVVLSLGCAGAPSTPVTQAPLDPTRQAELAALFVGAWSLEGIETHKGKRSDMGTVRITYYFNEDGTGRYEQIVGLPGADAVNPFEWTLDGRNMILTGHKPGSKPATFRVEHWSGLEMIWFNYTDSSNFYFARQR